MFSCWLPYSAINLKLIFLTVGHTLVSVNGMKVTGQQLDDGRDAMQVLANEANYPINLKFARPKLTTNEKIFQVSVC